MEINITTAVDSLVNLVKEKGMVSLEDASKILKIPENIINEWATFLEEEKLISIEYKFTTPYLVAKKESVLKEQISEEQIDLIRRKVGVMISCVEGVNIKPKTKNINLKHLTKDSCREDRLYIQKQFLLEELKKLLNNLKNIKNYKKFKPSYIKLLGYYDVFKRNSQNIK